jgi:hypothetical protein
MSYIDDLEDAATRAQSSAQLSEDAAELLYNVANGGSSAVVLTDSGTVKSVAKAISDIESSLSTGLSSVETTVYTVSAGQTTVELGETSVENIAIYANGIRLFDWSSSGQNTVVFNEAFTEETDLYVVSREVEAGVSDSDVYRAQTLLSRSLSKSEYRDDQLLYADFKGQAFGIGEVGLGLTNPRTFYGMFDYSRGSVGSYENADGDTSSADADVAMFNYTGGEPDGLLVGTDETIRATLPQSISSRDSFLLYAEAVQNSTTGAVVYMRGSQGLGDSFRVGIPTNNDQAAYYSSPDGASGSVSLSSYPNAATGSLVKIAVFYERGVQLKVSINGTTQTLTADSGNDFKYLQVGSISGSNNAMDGTIGFLEILNAGSYTNSELNSLTAI